MIFSRTVSFGIYVKTDRLNTALECQNWYAPIFIAIRCAWNGCSIRVSLSYGASTYAYPMVMMILVTSNIN
jgi:hypothetical protein